MSTAADARANRERSFNMEPVLARKSGWSVAVQVVTIKKNQTEKAPGLFSTQDNKCFRHIRTEKHPGVICCYS